MSTATNWGDSSLSSPALRYGIAFGLATLACAARQIVFPILGSELPYLFYYPVVVFSAWAGGLGPGLLATALSALLADYFLLQPRQSLAPLRPIDQIGLLLFCLFSIGICWWVQRIRRALQLTAQTRVLARQAELLRTHTEALEGAYEAVRRRESQLRKLGRAVEQSPASVIITDPTGAIEYVNPKFTQVTGYTLEEVVGKNPRVLKSGLMPSSVYQELWETIASGDEWRGELHNIRKDGTLFWEQASISPVLDEHGAVTHFVAVKEDITERKEAEREYQREMAFTAAMLDTARAAILVLDHERQILRFNRYCEQISGYTFEEVKGLRVRDVLMPDEAQDAARNAMGRLSKTDGLDYFENEWKTRSGELRRLAWSSTLIPSPDGDSQLTLGVALDITDNKRAEEDLRLKSRLIDLAHDAILIRNDQGKITYWNQGASRMYGWTREEALGQVSYELLQTGFPCSLAAIEGSLRAHGAWEGELVHKTREGRPIVVSSRWVLEYNDRGEPGDLLQINTDITERKRAEELLALRAEELARSNRDLEQFAYVASHDLQEPLRSVSSYLSLLAGRCSGQFDKKGDTYIKFALQGASRMQALIDDLLAYSRVRSCHRPFERVDTALAVSQAVENLRRTIKDAQAELTCDWLPAVSGDHRGLVQLFQNLLGNAIKFTSDGPPRVRIGVERRGRNWIFAVKDNGIGIAAEHADEIFDIFIRLHTRDEYPGSGVGLAICKRIVEAHGGRIWVESRKGEGATFRFTIPVTLEETERDAAQEPAAGITRG